MASSEPEKSVDRKVRDVEEDDHSFIHIRVDSGLKRDLASYASKENTSLTAVLTAIIEDLLYKQDEDEGDDDEDELLDLIVESLMNLERRMEIRLATLQDTFNSLIGRLIDSQHAAKTLKPSQLRKRRKGDVGDAQDDEVLDLSDVLSVNKEEEIYKRVKRYLEQQGRVIDLPTVIQQIEVDRTLKGYLDDQDAHSPGLKDALITDAIQEAAYELGFPMIDSI